MKRLCNETECSSTGFSNTDAEKGNAMSSSSKSDDKRKIRTMQDLSDAIGVSRPTLSRYFHDGTTVRPATREKIREGLECVDYIPNFFATRMNRKSTGLIGVIIPYFNDLFFTSLLGSIELAASEAGFTIITQSSHGDSAVETRAAEMLLSMNVDGVIVAPLGRSSAREALARLSANLPLVFVDSRLPETFPDVDFVGTDNEQSMGLIIDYLCRTGSPPVFLGMPTMNSNALEREDAYRNRLQALGHEPELILSDVSTDTWNFEAYAHDVMDAHFARGAFGNATILCANDRLAIGVIRAASRHGLFRVDEKGGSLLRVAGHDDHPLSSFMTPTLTTVAQDAGAIGSAVVSRLVESIEAGRLSGDDASEARCEAVLKIRESA